MIRFLLVALALALTTAPPAARAGDPRGACLLAAERLEEARSLPDGLLQAIALVETGRPRPDHPARFAWPWTIHAEGRGQWFDSRAEAVAAVEALQARGVKSIDVGCFQVNLKHHPAAFRDLESAFTPAENARYAADFLKKLFGRTRSWTMATAHYHSSNPDNGLPYRQRVMQAMDEVRRLAAEAWRARRLEAWRAEQGNDQG